MRKFAGRRHPGVADEERLGGRGDLLVAAGKTDEIRVEALDVLTDDGRCVVFGIDAYHHNVDVLRCVGLLVDTTELGKRQRADVRAARVTEEHQGQLAGEVVSQVYGLTAAVDQVQAGYGDGVLQRRAGQLRSGPERDAQTICSEPGCDGDGDQKYVERVPAHTFEYRL